MATNADQDKTGKRLDQFVAAAMPGLSRAFIQKLIGQGKVSVNSQPAKPGNKLRESDDVQIDYDPATAEKVEEITLPILYEDNDCVVINKPAGVLTHALGVHGTEPSVASFLRGRTDGLSGDRAGIVHRLDRATSGVIVGAKNQAALSWLQKQFSQRNVKKTYIAIVEGTPKSAEAVIDMPIGRNPKAPATFRVNANGKSAITHYRVLKSGKNTSLIELRPETGRTHQLRVHMAKIGHPIKGDPLYGSGEFGQQMYLHAHQLEITLPSRERKVFSAPVPKSFEGQIVNE